MSKERLDVFLVKKKIFESREKAIREIMAGNVLVNERVITKAGFLISEDDIIRVKEIFPYVSRGALKLKYALEYFNLDVMDKVAIDVGASKGGFTEVLLEKGAKFVYAVDSGVNQIAWKLRTDPRVAVLEKTNARYIDKMEFDPVPEVATVDVSFISVTKILPSLIKVLKGSFWIVILIKPQFELEKSKILKGGVAKEEFRKEAIDKVLNFAASIGLKTYEVIESPITGYKSGNTEYLTYLTEK
jgi:23S rRNA (cytidine1920-2'-O)/16S rRNA (cytidine1409-2'-O)-methyltransferase